MNIAVLLADSELVPSRVDCNREDRGWKAIRLDHSRKFALTIRVVFEYLDFVPAGSSRNNESAIVAELGGQQVPIVHLLDVLGRVVDVENAPLLGKREHLHDVVVAVAAGHDHVLEHVDGVAGDLGAWHRADLVRVPQVVDLDRPVPAGAGKNMVLLRMAPDSKDSVLVAGHLQVAVVDGSGELHGLVVVDVEVPVSSADDQLGSTPVVVLDSRRVPKFVLRFVDEDVLRVVRGSHVVLHDRSVCRQRGDPSTLLSLLAIPLRLPPDTRERDLGLSGVDLVVVQHCAHPSSEGAVELNVAVEGCNCQVVAAGLEGH